MKRYLAFIGGLILLMIGIMLPLLVARLAVEWEIRFWLASFLTLIAFMFITPVFLLLGAIVIGPSFPGIGSKINKAGEKASNSVVNFCFNIRFAGKDSYWQHKESAKATVFAGLWHGIILPITFFFSYFSNRITIYEGKNDGFTYNYGFIAGAVGIIAFLLDTEAFLEANYLSFVVIVGLPLIAFRLLLNANKL